MCWWFARVCGGSSKQMPGLIMEVTGGLTTPSKAWGSLRDSPRRVRLILWLKWPIIQVDRAADRVRGYLCHPAAQGLTVQVSDRARPQLGTTGWTHCLASCRICSCLQRGSCHGQPRVPPWKNVSRCSGFDHEAVQYRWTQHLLASQTEKGPRPFLQAAKFADTISLSCLTRLHPGQCCAKFASWARPNVSFGERMCGKQLGCSQWDIKLSSWHITAIFQVCLARTSPFRLRLPLEVQEAEEKSVHLRVRG